MTKAKRFTVVEMQGSHYNMGRQYGSQCRDMIRDLAAKVDGIILHERNIEQGKAVAREAIPCVRKAAPELIDEVQGIADGAGIEFEDVFRLNCSKELLSWQGCVGSKAGPTAATGCSSFALRAKEGTLVAWNMDWWRLWLPHMVLLHGVPDDGPRFFAFALAGCVGRPGMSEHVAVSANQLPHRGGIAPGAANRWDGRGVPYNFLVRIMLKQRSTADAAAAATALDRMSSLNYTLGDTSGDIRCIETTPRDYAEILPASDFVTHANSYHTAKFNGIPEAELAKQDPRSFDAHRQLDQLPRPLDRQALAAIQTSHFSGEPTGICVHRKSNGRESITLLSFIAQVNAGKLWAAVGPPCEHEFLEYGL